MADYDGIPYHDSMASSKRVRIALEALDEAAGGSA